MRIFITGGSGLGKSTLLNEVNRRLGLKKYTEITRKLQQSNTDFYSMGQVLRQTMIETAYKRLMKEEMVDGISDRSILDIEAWTNFVTNRNVKSSVNKDCFKAGDVLVIVPTPDLSWFVNHKTHFYSDDIRFKIYHEAKTKLGKTDETLVEFVYNTSKFLEDIIDSFASEIPDLRIFKPDLNPENFFDWQFKSLEFIESLKSSESAAQ